MQYIDSIPVWGEHEANTLEQARTCARTADYFALMADGHLGYGVPIGGVIASESRISPTAVGFDNRLRQTRAVRLDMPGSELRANIHRIMDDIWSTLSFGVGRRNAENNSDSPFITDKHEGWSTEAARPLKQKANAQLGTIGSGNPLRRSLHRRARPRLGRRALRVTRPRATALRRGSSRQPEPPTA